MSLMDPVFYPYYCFAVFPSKKGIVLQEKSEKFRGYPHIKTYKMIDMFIFECLKEGS